MARITLFAQVIQKLPKELIKSLVRKHGTDKHSKCFNTWNLLAIFYPYRRIAQHLSVTLQAVVKEEFSLVAVAPSECPR